MNKVRLAAATLALVLLGTCLSTRAYCWWGAHSEESNGNTNWQYDWGMGENGWHDWDKGESGWHDWNKGESGWHDWNKGENGWHDWFDGDYSWHDWGKGENGWCDWFDGDHPWRDWFNGDHPWHDWCNDNGDTPPVDQTTANVVQTDGVLALGNSPGIAAIDGDADLDGDIDSDDLGAFDSSWAPGGISGIDVTVVPEPGSLSLLAIGAAGLLALGWRQRR